MKMNDYRKVTADLTVCLYKESDMLDSSVMGVGEERDRLDPGKTEALIGITLTLCIGQHVISSCLHVIPADFVLLNFGKSHCVTRAQMVERMSRKLRDLRTARDRREQRKKEREKTMEMEKGKEKEKRRK